MAELSPTGIENRTKREVILGQARPANTTAVSLYTPAPNVIATITKVMICNTTGIAAVYRLFIHNTGTTYDETTALVFDKSVAANDFALLELDLPMADDTGNLAVRTATNDALTFTAWGYERYR